jgi:predicted nucleic acid-binding protein
MKQRTPKRTSPARTAAVPRPRVYLDSTIPSYYFDERAEILNYVADTRHWWDKESAAYDLWLSQATLRELAQGGHPYREKILEFVRKVQVLPEDRMVLELAQTYIDHKLMPASLEGDAAHLAYASFYGFNYLLTWNCNHLANANKRRHIEVINNRLGLASPLIVTPQMLVKETKP